MFEVASLRLPVYSDGWDKGTRDLPGSLPGSCFVLVGLVERH